MYYLFSFISLLLITIKVSGQETPKDSTLYKTHTVQDLRIEQLNKTYSSTYELKGYRIQIYSGNKKQPARETRLKFSKLYTKVNAHEFYQQPYFKVRVGDFKTKIEALKFQKELLEHFPNCFIVKDKIDFKD